MMKIRPGARFGIAVPIAGEVKLIPLRNKDWKANLHDNGQENFKSITLYIILQIWRTKTQIGKCRYRWQNLEGKELHKH